MIDPTSSDSSSPGPKISPISREPSAIKKKLIALADVFVEAVLAGGLIHEGVVTSMYRPPYRRLDCDGRALAYVRVRPKKGHVRIDVTGLWLAQRAPRLRVPGAAGTIALIARDEAEIAEICAYLNETVVRTRAAFARRSR